MAHDIDLTEKKLSWLWRCDEIPVLDITGNKYVIMSDVHLGDGKRADDLRSNENVLISALDYYNQQGYSLILLGDIEELWQFELEEISRRYLYTTYRAIRAFGDERVHRVFGNHDIDWRTLPDLAKNKQPIPACATEALKMRDGGGNTCIMMVHGHQGDEDSDKNAWSSRYWVRSYRYVEGFFKLDPHTATTQSQITTEYEKIFYTWAKEAKAILICGHSHRAIFASKSFAEQLEEDRKKKEKEISANRDNKEKVKELEKELKEIEKKLKKEKKRKRKIVPVESDGKPPLPCYFNTGCALYTDGITTIEIADDKIRLVKWNKDAPKDQQFKVYGEDVLSTFIDQVTG